MVRKMRKMTKFDGTEAIVWECSGRVQNEEFESYDDDDDKDNGKFRSGHGEVER